MKLNIIRAAFSAVLLVAMLGCEAKKSSNPLSPTVAGPIPGVEITPPRLLEPYAGVRFKESDLPLRLLIENSSSTGVRPLSYTIEVATDAGFGTKVFARSGVAPGDAGRTAVQVDALELGRSYYWRVRAEDGANQSEFTAAQFELLPRAVLAAPVLVGPVNNERTPDRQPNLRIRNADRNSAVGPVSYFFVVATDQAFTRIAATGAVAEGPGETTWTPDRLLDASLTQFWRVRATDGEIVSEWSVTQAFQTPAAPAPAPPAPGPAPGGPCTSSSPLNIVECERNKYPGTMSGSQLATFLRSVARSLTANGVSGAPFGILRKGSGHNCNGYSCDIVCSGQGGGQQQWDVLGDVDGAQYPAWGGPLSSIRVDICEIQ